MFKTISALLCGGCLHDLDRAIIVSCRVSPIKTGSVDDSNRPIDARYCAVRRKRCAGM